MELKKEKEASEIEINKFQQMVNAMGKLLLTKSVCGKIPTVFTMEGNLNGKRSKHVSGVSDSSCSKFRVNLKIKFKSTFKLGADTIKAMASAGQDHQVKMLQSLGLTSTLITGKFHSYIIFKTVRSRMACARLRWGIMTS